MAEHTLYGKRKLCYTEVTDFTDIQGIGRDPLYKRFDSVYSVIEKNIEPKYRDFLAHPIYSDEDQILWYVREWNNTPCPYKDLSEADKAKYAAIKAETIAAYDKARSSLTGEDKQILTGALKYIDDDFIFCYDDKIVLVAWGMSPDSKKHVVKGAVIHDLKIQNNHKIQFIVGEHGSLRDRLAGIVSRPAGATLSNIDLPQVTPNKGYTFKGWEPNPLGMKVNGPLTFNAVYEEIPVEKAHVTFIADNGGYISGSAEHTIDAGTCIVASQIPMAIPSTGFEFIGWDKPTDEPIYGDTTFFARFKQKSVTCRFIAGSHGSIAGADSFILPYGTILDGTNIPAVAVNDGYKFTGWDKSPAGFVLNGDATFTATYEEHIPWYKRLWRWLVGIWTWLTGRGCLKWLLWLLLIILFIWLLSYLLRGCELHRGNDTVAPLPEIETPDGRIIDDNGPITGIVGDDGTLPDHNVVAPIIGDDGQKPPIISNPGTPDIISNRLNIYFEDVNVDLQQFVADLSKIYPESQCQVIGVDREVPMMQIRIPENMRNTIRNGLNAKLPNYQFFIVDESIFLLKGNIGTETSNAGWHLDAIHVKKGWEITKGKSDVIVAVVDDGIDASHEILKGKIVSPYNVFTKDNRLGLGKGHGTHVAGLAVGSDKHVANGISGVAPCCRLMPVQVFDNDLCTFSSLTSGIMYAIHHGASVVNVSIGPNLEGLDELPLPEQKRIAETQFKNEERVWQRIINVANEHNAIIVFATGNNHILASIPPENRTNHTINVAAVDSRIQGTEFTNYGIGSNISAPGQDIVSSMPVNKYQSLSGTSMAAPIVSGMVALMKSCKPEVSVSEVLRILRATGKRVSNHIPPMIQVDDALIALTTGVIPKMPSTGDDANPDNSVPATGDDNYTDNAPINDGAPSNGGIVGGDNNNGSADGSADGKADETDYDAIRKLIESLKQQIRDLEKQLPENK